MQSENREKKWDTFVHAGVLFPPEYEPHGVRMLYEGKPVELTAEQVHGRQASALHHREDIISMGMMSLSSSAMCSESSRHTELLCATHACSDSLSQSMASPSCQP